MGIEEALLIEETAVINGASIRISNAKFHPAFVKVPLLRYKAMTGPRILEHHVHGDNLARDYRESLFFNGRNQSDIAFFNAKNVNVDCIFEKVFRLLQLLRVVIESGNGGVRSQPPM